MDSRAKELVTIGKSLFTKKEQWNQLCQEIAENFYPLRADFVSDFTLGEDFAMGLMDSFPVQSRETLGNAPEAMLRQGEWFGVKTGIEEIDEDPSAARWMESATVKLRRLVYDRRTNFGRAMKEADHDWVTFGNPVLSVEESPNRDHFLYRSWHPKECAWMENSVGRIDHLHREMPMTARNIMARKAWAKNVHPDIKKAAETNPAQPFKIRHVVLPADEMYGDDRKAMRRFKDMPFVSLYIDCEHEVVLGEGPLPVFNYIVPRWRTLSGIPFGFSPATITALPDGRMLQALSRIILEQGEKAVDAPMYAKGEIFRDAVNRYAGGLTYVDLEGDEDIRKSLFFEEPSKGMGVGFEMKADVRNLIAEAFLLNKLTLPSAREMRELEVQARMDEYRRAVLPFFGPIETEIHLPVLDTTFQMALRNNQFDLDDMPDILSGGEVTFNFESPLSTAEGRQSVMAFQESIQILGASVQFDETLVSSMNLKQMTKDAVKGTGAKADWFNDEETELAEEEQAKQTQGLIKAAMFLREGAAAGTEVANATMAAKQAGLAA